MTLEEVEALGDEALSRLCAERVMGWREERGMWWGKDPEWVGQLSRDEDWVGGEARWDPAANVSDAWVLVLEIEKRGGLAWSQFQFWFYTGSISGGKEAVARRICLAALRSVGAIGSDHESERLSARPTA